MAFALLLDPPAATVLPVWTGDKGTGGRGTGDGGMRLGAGDLCL